MSTTVSTDPAPAADPVATLAAQVTGRVMRPDDPGFADEIAGFNAATVHRPDVVVVASDATYRWLCELKAAYDPANLFRFGHAIAEGRVLSRRVS